VDSKQKIFNPKALLPILIVLLAFMLAKAASPQDLVPNGVTVRILKPGDVVKGKVLDTYYYCFDEASNLKLMEIFKAVELNRELIRAKDEELDRLQAVVVLNRMLIEKKDEEVARLKKALEDFDKLNDEMEHKLAASDAKCQRANRRARNSFWFGMAAGGGVLLGGRELVVGGTGK